MSCNEFYHLLLLWTSVINFMNFVLGPYLVKPFTIQGLT